MVDEEMTMTESRSGSGVCDVATDGAEGSAVTGAVDLEEETVPLLMTVAVGTADDGGADIVTVWDGGAVVRRTMLIGARRCTGGATVVGVEEVDVNVGVETGREVVELEDNLGAGSTEDEEE